jgi:hypothetical protein
LADHGIEGFKYICGERTESFLLGEAVAIGLLQEMSLGFNEDDAFFELTRFDGQKIRIFDGKVVPVT